MVKTNYTQDEFYKKVMDYSKSYYMTYRTQMFKLITAEDFVSEMVTKAVSQKLFEKFDGRIELSALVFSSCKRYKIDLFRRTNTRVKEVSYDNKLNSSGESFIYFIAGDEDVDCKQVLIQEVMERLSEESFSPRYDLSPKRLFEMLTKGSDPESIAYEIGISKARVQQLVRIVLAEVKTVWGMA